MPIEAVVATPGSSIAAEPTRTPKQSMDSEVFMHLLVTQLRNQDPSSPMDTNDMIAQTTQLASMEQLTAMAKMDEENFSLQMRIAAAALIGQNVTYTNDEGVAVTGTAKSVSYAAGVPTVNIEGEDVLLDRISGVVSAESTPKAPAVTA
ncbi:MULTISPECIES: flagellar hook capping FlgD N-terminal domain-containing protein [unclassified Arthrobacter]|uniref:flagellar hook assembly protein FlgD n=1 Tax=unclassified Arthrobacter TaxID=235627 RepID=UPI0024DF4104|nr:MULTISPECIES: flagellar hook capping FlgD N-terminal domain-containing protein [unclassified Arthrobacter]MCC9146669.1 flagellar hook capping protein [Arthrobacter sp. zg-Y919]MDK1277899.1 flagellar hook capping FlgD N-terminal domain-containing protein [Arthrobacter sp. zg.Y919]MDM7990886.1 flagellar hook capping FlgD N-terminal domain-containing protein [Arthrobacter sp. zg-Y877]WIB03506.1 flagellar hook capping FlgD N-terminal domain-containing protein [Arthrobacter sp. zg-Y919]